jgi:hypothetical protein
MQRDQPVPGIPGAVMRRVATVQGPLPGGMPAGANMEATPGLLRFVAPGTGVFLIRDGEMIEFAPETGADPGMVNLFLHGTARGALIHMRGDLALHAATFLPPDGQAALAICGRSGAGKSTLGAELSRRGWRLIADDVTRITWDGAAALAWPSGGALKLWRDSCEATGLAIGELERVSRSMDKYYLPVPAHPAPAPLAAILELASDEPRLSLSPGERMAVITRNTYRRSHVQPLGMLPAYMDIAAHVAGSVRFLQLPGKDRHAPPALADTVEAAMGADVAREPDRVV